MNLPHTLSTPPVICLMGPTASGKTALALALADNYPIEIISVDSALIYRDMNIGSAKPTPAELAAVPHHLIDILDPTARYSAGQFVTDATQLIQQIRAKGKIPLLVGGTMLYFKALQEGIAELPTENPSLRAEILQRAEQEGWPKLHAELMRIDPEFASKINPQDTQRIGRGLEVFYLSGQSLSSLHKQNQRPPAFPTLSFALLPDDRSLLHRRIEQRITSMLQAGFVEEVMQLRQKYTLHPDFPSMRAVGYRQVWDYLEGHISEKALPEQILFATRKYAKRQLTWLRTWPHLNSLQIETLFQQDNLNPIKQALQAQANVDSTE